MKTLLTLATLSGVALGVTIAIGTHPAHAKLDRLPGIICQRATEVGALSLSDHLYNTSDTGSWVESNVASSYLCYLPDETSRQLPTVNSITVDVWDGNHTAGQHVHVKACAVGPTNVYGGCGFGGQFSSSNFNPNGTPNDNYTGNATLQAQLTATDQGGVPLFDYAEVGYLWISMPSATVSPAKIKAIHVSSPL